MLGVSETSNIWQSPNEGGPGNVKLTASESTRLLAICVELIDLCSKMTARVDPAAGSLVAHARDEALAGVARVEA